MWEVPGTSHLPAPRLEKEIDALENGELAPAPPKENNTAPSPAQAPALALSPGKEEHKIEMAMNSQQVRVGLEWQVLCETIVQSTWG